MTQRRLEDRELNKARSKPHTVDRPVRTARIFVHHYNSTQYCNTETVFIYIPLPPDQHHISDVTKVMVRVYHFRTEYKCRLIGRVELKYA